MIVRKVSPSSGSIGIGFIIMDPMVANGDWEAAGQLHHMIDRVDRSVDWVPNQ